MRAIVISCQHQSDRRAVLRDTLRRLQLDFSFHIVTRDDECPRRGCYRSHRAVARQLVQGGETDPVLVLEDDARLTVPVEHAQHWLLRLPPATTYDLYYCGLNPQRAQHLGNAEYRVAGFCTHAFVLSPRGARRMAALPDYAGVEIDRCLMEMCGAHSAAWQHSWTCLAQRHSIMRQDKRSISDITPNDPRYRLPSLAPLIERAMAVVDRVAEAWVYDAEQHLTRTQLLLLLVLLVLRSRGTLQLVSCAALSVALLRLER
jgi:hypothetical protein